MSGNLYSTVQFDLLFSNLSDANQSVVESFCGQILLNEKALKPVEFFDVNLGKTFFTVRIDKVIVTYERRSADYVLLTCVRRDR